MVPNKDGTLPLDTEPTWQLWEIEHNSDHYLIPGDVLFGDRIPFDAMHSRKYVRLRYNINRGGSLSIISKFAKTRDGSDSDGDTLFSEILYRNTSGRIYTEGQKGRRNQVVLLQTLDFSDIRNLEQYRAVVTNKMSRHIMDQYPGTETDYTNDNASYVRARIRNLQSSKLRGILVNANTIVKYLVKKKVAFKTATRKYGQLDGLTVVYKDRADSQDTVSIAVARSEFGEKDGPEDPLFATNAVLAHAISLAMDNAKLGPYGLEGLSLNEVTWPLFLTLVLSDPVAQNYRRATPPRPYTAPDAGRRFVPDS